MTGGRRKNRKSAKVVDLGEARLKLAADRGFRNWKSQLGEACGLQTRLSHLSPKTLAVLAIGKGRAAFYLYELIMNLETLGSGFEFDELNPKDKIAVTDRYLFLLDRVRFEYMKRLGWLEAYPGEEHTLVELVTGFDGLAPRLQADTPVLSPSHPEFEAFDQMSASDKEWMIRKLIPKVLKIIEDQSTTL